MSEIPGPALKTRPKQPFLLIPVFSGAAQDCSTVVMQGKATAATAAEEEAWARRAAHCTVG